MKVKTSAMTASILAQQCDISADLQRQIKALPTKADSVYLDVEQADMKKAFITLKKFMHSSTQYHQSSYDAVLREIEYWAHCTY